MTRQLSPIIFWLLCSLVAIAALAFDLSQPLGVAGGIPSVLLVLLGLHATKYRVIIGLALMSSAINLLGFQHSTPGASLQVVLLNRGMVFIAIWFIAAAVILVVSQRKQLQQQSQLDPLTQCYNRNFLAGTLLREIQSWKNEKHPLSLIMLDIDHFKNVNDTHGHQVGDRVLSQVAKICSAHVRRGDSVCRYGGEEFAIVLPDADHHIAGEVAERIRKAVFNTTFDGAPRIVITVSLGVAEMSSRYASADALVQAADKALYHSKASGRDQVNIDKTGQLIRFPILQREKSVIMTSGR